METKLYRILSWGFACTILLFLGTIFYFSFLQSVPENVDFIALQQYRFEVLKSIGIGFLIALLGLVVPHLLATAKYNFELEKEGRKLYSEAITHIEYLPYEIPEMDFKQAIGHLKQMHQVKHLADLYYDPTRPGKKYREMFEEIKAFDKIAVVRAALNNEEEYLKKGFEERVKFLEEKIKST